MEFLGKKTPQVYFYNIHALVIGLLSTNKEELVKVDDCGAISVNDEAANNVYVVCFTYVSHTLQEYV